MKNVAVVGASGAVGERMIRLLEERSLSGGFHPISRLGPQRGSIGRLPRRVASDSRALRR